MWKDLTFGSRYKCFAAPVQIITWARVCWVKAELSARMSYFLPKIEYKKHWMIFFNSWCHYDVKLRAFLKTCMVVQLMVCLQWLMHCLSKANWQANTTRIDDRQKAKDGWIKTKDSRSKERRALFTDLSLKPLNIGVPILVWLTGSALLV